MDVIFSTVMQPDPVVAWYYLKFYREYVSRVADQLFLFWSAGRMAQERLLDCVWLTEVRDFFKEQFTKIPGVVWYEEGEGSLVDVRFGGNFVTHFDGQDYMFGDVPGETVYVSYDSDVFWWDISRLKFYVDLISNDQYDLVGSTPSGCGTQIQAVISKRRPPYNVHPSFVVIQTDNFCKVRPQKVPSLFNRPIRFRPYTWKAEELVNQLGIKVTETTHVDVFGWASLELFDRLKLNRFYEVIDPPRYQESYDSFIGESGWCHLAATSSLMYVWRTLFPGLENDILKWTRGRTLFGVARMLLGLRRLLEDQEFMRLKHARECIKEAQDGLEYMCQNKGITTDDIGRMQRRIIEQYPF